MLTRPLVTAFQDVVAGVAARLSDGHDPAGTGDGVAAVVRGDPFAGVDGRGGGGGLAAVEGVDGDRDLRAFPDGGELPKCFQGFTELCAGGLPQQRRQDGGGFVGSAQPVHALCVGQLRCRGHARNVTGDH